MDKEKTVPRKKILLVDDDLEIIEKIKLPLVIAEFEILEAYDGLRALELIRKEKPDLVIMDVIMPRLDGLKVTRLFKFDERYQHIPVIIVSHITNQDERMLQSLRVNQFFTKPFSTEEVMTTVHELLREK